MIKALSDISHDGTLYVSGDIFDAGNSEKQLIEIGSAEKIKEPKIKTVQEPKIKVDKKVK